MASLRASHMEGEGAGGACSAEMFFCIVSIKSDMLSFNAICRTGFYSKMRFSVMQCTTDATTSGIRTRQPTGALTTFEPAFLLMHLIPYTKSLFIILMPNI